jgi:hypothetical protein
MMTGRLYIDGKDVYKQFGVYVSGDDGWNDLIAMPPLKSVDSNDWQEEDGIEPDLSSPVLDTREVSIKFAVAGIYSRYFDFIALLSDGAKHTFNCAYIGRTYELRLVSAGNLDYAKILGFVTLKFADDSPLPNYTYTPPVSSIAPLDDYAIDGANFTDYGVRVLQGTLSEVIKNSDVKINLLRNIQTKSGAIYDSKVVVYKSKDVKIYCLMRAGTLEELWRNYDALLYDLTRPGERTLWVNELEQEFPCYYKSCAVSEFYPDGKIWLKFTITLTFTSDFRISEDDTVLASEDNIIIYTENDIYAIDLLLDRYSYPSYGS